MPGVAAAVDRKLAEAESLLDLLRLVPETGPKTHRLVLDDRYAQDQFRNHLWGLMWADPMRPRRLTVSNIAHRSSVQHTRLANFLLGYRELRYIDMDSVLTAIFRIQTDLEADLAAAEVPLLDGTAPPRTELHVTVPWRRIDGVLL